MGMSASQVRLLTVTKRIHEVENEAQRVQNQKMLLGLESDEAYEEYLAAMEQQNIEQAIFNSDTGTFEWNVANIATMFANGYRFQVQNPLQPSVTLNAGTVNVLTFNSTTHEVEANGAALADPTLYVPENTTSITAGTMLYKDPDCTIPYGTVKSLTQPDDDAAGSYQLELSSSLQVDSWPALRDALGIDSNNNALETNPNLLRELVYNAKILILSLQLADDGVNHEWKETNIATNVGLRENEDDSRIARAEADYEAALRRIDKKEEKYDADLAKMDQERLALTTQLDTFKTCSKDNIDRTFKVFS